MAMVYADEGCFVDVPPPSRGKGKIIDPQVRELFKKAAVKPGCWFKIGEITGNGNYYIPTEFQKDYKSCRRTVGKDKYAVFIMKKMEQPQTQPQASKRRLVVVGVSRPF